MTDFIVTITDPEQLAGITWAREQYNASLPPPPMPMPPDTVTGGMASAMAAAIGGDDALTPSGTHVPPALAPERMGIEGELSEDEPSPQVQPDGTLDTDQEYVQWVMEQAAASYAMQQEQAQWRQAYEDAQAESRAKMRSG